MANITYRWWRKALNSSSNSSKLMMSHTHSNCQQLTLSYLIHHSSHSTLFTICNHHLLLTFVSRYHPITFSMPMNTFFIASYRYRTKTCFNPIALCNATHTLHFFIDDIVKDSFFSSSSSWLLWWWFRWNSKTAAEAQRECGSSFTRSPRRQINTCCSSSEAMWLL